MPDRVGRITSADDFNSYGFRLNAGQLYMITVTGDGGDPLPDAVLTVRRGGTIVAQDDDSGPGTDPLLYYRPSSTGQYSVRVDGFAGNVGDYRLTLEMDDYRNTYDGPGPAAKINPGGSFSGRISYDGDTDIIGVRLEAGVTYVFYMRGEPTGDGTLADPVLNLFGRAGALLDGDDDSGTGTNARFVYTAAYTGQYWLSADGFSTNTGSYRVLVSEGTTPLAEPGHDAAPPAKPQHEAADDHGGLFADLAPFDAGADFLL